MVRPDPLVWRVWSSASPRIGTEGWEPTKPTNFLRKIVNFYHEVDRIGLLEKVLGTKSKNYLSVINIIEPMKVIV